MLLISWEYTFTYSFTHKFHSHLEIVLLLHWEKTPKNICYVLFYYSNEATPYCYQSIKRDWLIYVKKGEKRKKEDKSPSAKEKKTAKSLFLD